MKMPACMIINSTDSLSQNTCTFYKAQMKQLQVCFTTFFVQQSRTETFVHKLQIRIFESTLVVYYLKVNETIRKYRNTKRNIITILMATSGSMPIIFF